MFATQVHTTGINVQGLLATVASLTIIVTAIVGFFARWLIKSFRTNVSEAVQAIIDAKVVPVLKEIHVTLSEHDTRLARLEGIEQGKRQAFNQATLTTTPPTT
jgi:hypothetical protein